MLRLLKDKFHHCLNMCKSLDYQATLTSTIGKVALELIAPDKLIYDYAIEMCQTAALEELFGHPEEVSELPPSSCYQSNANTFFLVGVTALALLL